MLLSRLRLFCQSPEFCVRPTLQAKVTLVCGPKTWDWDDPRFPTVRGTFSAASCPGNLLIFAIEIRRRGMTIEALTQFMLLQGHPKQSCQ